MGGRGRPARQWGRLPAVVWWRLNESWRRPDSRPNRDDGFLVDLTFSRVITQNWLDLHQLCGDESQWIVLCNIRLDSVTVYHEETSFRPGRVRFKPSV